MYFRPSNQFMFNFLSPLGGCKIFSLSLYAKLYKVLKGIISEKTPFTEMSQETKKCTIVNTDNIFECVWRFCSASHKPDFPTI